MEVGPTVNLGPVQASVNRSGLGLASHSVLVRRGSPLLEAGLWQVAASGGMDLGLLRFFIFNDPNEL